MVDDGGRWNILDNTDTIADKQAYMLLLMPSLCKLYILNIFIVKLIRREVYLQRFTFHYNSRQSIIYVDILWVFMCEKDSFCRC